jgi:hypothetical protein
LLIIPNVGEKNMQPKENMMRRIVRAAAVLAVVFMSSAVYAQPMRGSGGWGANGAYQRMYNQATVENISGEVMSVDKVMPMKGMRSGIHLTLKTSKETIQVHLGPAWFIERLDSKLEKGDKLEVKGSRVTVSGKPAIIAAELKKGGKVLVLRDSTGIPVWSGWRKGNP